MTITFTDDKDVIVYALEKVISYARGSQQIFVAQCVWWLASIIGLEQGLITYIDNLQSRIKESIIPKESETEDRETVSPDPRDIQEEDRQDKVLRECEEYLRDSRQQRKIAALKASGRTSTGLINPTSDTKRVLKRKGRGQSRLTRNDKESRVVGIDKDELRRRRLAGECLRCAWPSDRKGHHQVVNCRRPIKLDKGTTSFPENKQHRKLKQLNEKYTIKENHIDQSGSEESSD